MTRRGIQELFGIEGENLENISGGLRLERIYIKYSLSMIALRKTSLRLMREMELMPLRMTVERTGKFK
jgi:hypothetical protein